MQAWSPRRRSLLLAAGAPAGLLAGGCAANEVKVFPTLASAQQAIAALGQGGWRSSGSFTLAQMLNHAAQSIEYSVHGYPESRSALFRQTAGRAAFALFDARGSMSHSLADPIPGAPLLSAADPLPAAVMRAQQALLLFDQHQGALQPHFAYGSLSKSQYLRAHLMHLANHWTEVVRV